MRWAIPPAVADSFSVPTWVSHSLSVSKRMRFKTASRSRQLLRLRVRAAFFSIEVWADVKAVATDVCSDFLNRS
jgi:hypothetical protein